MTKTYTWFTQLGNLTSNFFAWKLGVTLLWRKKVSIKICIITLLTKLVWRPAKHLCTLDVDWVETKDLGTGGFLF